MITSHLKNHKTKNYFFLVLWLFLSTSQILYSQLTHKFTTSSYNGPQDIAISSDDKFVYTVSSGSIDGVNVFSLNKTTGILTPIQSLQDGSGNAMGLSDCYSVIISPDGNFVYIAGRFYISIFSRNIITGELTFVALNDNVENSSSKEIGISPDGKFLFMLNWADDRIVVFSRNLNTGILSYQFKIEDGDSGISGLDGVKDLEISSDGKFLYTSSFYDSAISVFSINQNSGDLNQLQVLKSYQGTAFSIEAPDDMYIMEDKLFVVTGSALLVYNINQANGLLSDYSKHVAIFSDIVSGYQFGNSIITSSNYEFIYMGIRNDSDSNPKLAVLSIDENDYISLLQTFTDNSSSSIQIDGLSSLSITNDGKFVIATSFGESNINVFQNNQISSTLPELEFSQCIAGALEINSGNDYSATFNVKNIGTTTWTGDITVLIVDETDSDNNQIIYTGTNQTIISGNSLSINTGVDIINLSEGNYRVITFYTNGPNNPDFVSRGTCTPFITENNTEIHYRALTINPIQNQSESYSISHHHQKGENGYFEYSNRLKTYNSSVTGITKKFSVCADGSDVSIFSIRSIDGKSVDNWNCRIKEDSSPSNAELFGSFGISNNTNNGDIDFRYTHPDYINGTDKNVTYTVELYNTITNETIEEFQLEIWRAPIIMLHGLWGNSGSFRVMEEGILNSNLYNPFQLYRHDYEVSNGKPFNENIIQVEKAIKIEIKKCVKEKIAAGRVDILAHSMGGIISRMYLQSDNYSDDIHKLITYNTPHSGSQGANILLDSEAPFLIHALCLYAAPNYLGECHDDAVWDLRVNSDAILNQLNGVNKNKNVVPSHVFYSTTTLNEFIPEPSPVIKKIKVPTGFWQLISVTKAALSAYVDELYDYDKHDLVVPRYSQIGGLFGNQISEYEDSYFHMTVHKQADVISKTLNLLKIKSNSTFFSRVGFNPPKLQYKTPLFWGTSSFITANDAKAINPNLDVQIINPNYEQIFKGGDNLTISVNGGQAIDNLVILLDIGNEEVLRAEQPGTSATFNYIIPADIIGKKRIIAVGHDFDTKTMVVDTSYIIIEPISMPNDISVYPEAIELEVGDYSSLKIYAHFGENIIDISRFEDLQFNFSHGLVSHVENIVIGNQIGRTNLNLTYKGISKNIPISVVGNEECIFAEEFQPPTGVINSGTYNSSSNLNSDGIVQTNNNVSFFAGNTINLTTGFHAKAGANFKAIIKDCNTSLNELDGLTCNGAIEVTNIPDIIASVGPSEGNGATHNPATHANWYYFIAPETGEVEIMSCLQGVDTRLWVYEGDCNNLTVVGSADDECALSSTSTNNYASKATINVQQGKQYYIEWDNRWSSQGFVFEIKFNNEVCPPVITSHSNGDELDNGCSDATNPREWHFEWTACNEATEFELELEGGIIFNNGSNVIRTSDNFYEQTSYSYYLNESPIQTFVKVRALIDDEWTTFSPKVRIVLEPFDTDCPDICPQILTPYRFQQNVDNGCTDFSNDLELFFDWPDCEGATKYHLYVKRETATSPIISNSEITESFFRETRSGFISDINRHDWVCKVRALINGTWTDWSIDRTFSFEPVNTDCPNLLLDSYGNRSSSVFNHSNSVELINTDLELEIFPNPFQSRTTIRYYLSKSGEVDLQLRDLLGRNIKVLLNVLVF